jgi:hypothetical protein
MIEITTGVAFLVSSIYGTGHAMNTATPAMQDSNENQATVTAVKLFTDPKEVESYLREEYAETPILIEVARCESHFKQYNLDGTVVRGKVDRADIGVMQINERYHGEKADDLGIDIYTVQGNVAFAKYLYGKYGSQPWSASAPCWKYPAKEIAKK